MFEKINYTKEIIEDASPVEIVDIIKELVPTFKPQNVAFQDEDVTDGAKEEVHA